MTSLEIFPLLFMFIPLASLQELKNTSGHLGRYFHYKKESQFTNGKPHFSILLLPYAVNTITTRQRMQNNFGVRVQNQRYLLITCREILYESLFCLLLCLESCNASYLILMNNVIWRLRLEIHEIRCCHR